MTDEEKTSCAKNRLDTSIVYQQTAERRCSELADEFTRLEVQIATVLFAFVGFFFSSFDTNIETFSRLVLFILRLMFASSLFFLILSLIMGLLHLKNKEKFWENMANQRTIRFEKWRDAVEKKITFDEALAFHNGAGLQKGHYVLSPSWSWILQTIFLGISVVMLSTLFLVFLFH